MWRFVTLAVALTTAVGCQHDIVNSHTSNDVRNALYAPQATPGQGLLVVEGPDFARYGIRSVDLDSLKHHLRTTQPRLESFDWEIYSTAFTTIYAPPVNGWSASHFMYGLSSVVFGPANFNLDLSRSWGYADPGCTSMETLRWSDRFYEIKAGAGDIEAALWAAHVQYSGPTISEIHGWHRYWEGTPYHSDGLYIEIKPQRACQ